MFFRFVVLLFLPLLSLTAKESICLNMIVKNEREVIENCLNSVKPFIEYWVIVDTGSSDGTQQAILNALQDIPGELHERPWRNFGENRSEAFDLAQGKADYILFMDADDHLEFKEGFDWEQKELTADFYCMWRGTRDFSYLKPQLVRADLPLRWVGVTHEYLSCDGPYTSETLEEVFYATGDGGASAKDPKSKFGKNVALLVEGIKKEPNNERYAFYLAESYRDVGEKGKALEWFQKRIQMGGWDEELFWSKLQSAHMLRDLGLPLEVVGEAYLHAHLYRPHRIETLYYLAELYNNGREYEKAYKTLKLWDDVVQPKDRDVLFNEDWITEYGLALQLSICAYYVGHYHEAIAACNRLIENEQTPEGWKLLAESNRVFPMERLAELAASMVEKK
jgi:glycosyltransferase involved in cell wall biosynthesis